MDINFSYGSRDSNLTEPEIIKGGGLKGVYHYVWRPSKCFLLRLFEAARKQTVRISKTRDIIWIFKSCKSGALPPFSRYRGVLHNGERRGGKVSSSRLLEALFHSYA